MCKTEKKKKTSDFPSWFKTASQKYLLKKSVIYLKFIRQNKGMQLKRMQKGNSGSWKIAKQSMGWQISRKMGRMKKNKLEKVNCRRQKSNKNRICNSSKLNMLKSIIFSVLTDRLSRFTHQKQQTKPTGWISCFFKHPILYPLTLFRLRLPLLATMFRQPS